MKRLLLLAILVAAATLAVFAYVQAGTETATEDPAATDTRGQDTPTPTSMTGETGRITAPASTESTEDKTSREALAPPQTEAEPTVTLKGRCVYGGTTHPIAGCRVVVGGWAANQPHPDPQALWNGPPHQVTGNDGRFVVAFVSPPRFQYYISIDTPGRATMFGRWPALKAGRHELGDIQIPAGARITGRILDENRVPQAEAYITFHREGAQGMPRGIMLVEHSFDKATRGDGYFELNNTLAAGKWYPNVHGRGVIEPEVLEIPKAPVDREILVTVKAKDDLAITGTVFDDAGRPLAKAKVLAGLGPEMFGKFHTTAKTASAKDGSFHLECARQRADKPAALYACREGYEPLVTTEAHPWGTHGVVLRMQPGVDVELQVLDSATQKPVTDYALRCFPDLGVTYTPRARLIRESYNGHLRLEGHHENGLVKIPGLVEGKHLLLVSPTTNQYAPSGFCRFEVGKATPRQVVHVDPLRTRILEVVAKAGKPIPGTRVELFHSSAGQKINLWTKPHDVAKDLPWGPFFQLLQTGVTDSEGRLALEGPPGEKLGLRLNGPGHVPKLVQDVVLSEPRPLRVIVEVGATLQGTAGPLAVLKELEGEGQDAQAAPGFRLVRAGGGRMAPLPPDWNKCFPIAADGSFEIQNIPAGTWKLRFKYVPRQKLHWSNAVRLDVKTIPDLKDGETRQVQVDLAFLTPATLTGTADVNGKPLVKGSLAFYCKEPPCHQTIQAGEDGRFELRATAGTYEVTAMVPPGTTGGPFIVLLPPQSVPLSPGKAVEQNLQFHHGGLRLRLLGADGKTPAAHAELSCTTDDGKRALYIRRADAQGRVHMDVFPQGNFVLKVWPKHLADQLARIEHMRKNPRDWQQAMVSLGTLQVAPAETVTRDLVLPTAAGY